MCNLITPTFKWLDTLAAEAQQLFSLFLSNLTCSLLLCGLQAVTPGSDIHNIVASQYHDITTQLHGEDSATAQQAWSLVEAAVTARYGTVSHSSATELAVLNRTLYK
jgi:hypothetical protein